MQLKTLAFACFTAAALLSASASADDKRVAQCVEDNKDAGQTAEIVKKYCVCMDTKMGAGETSSVTDWEEGHADEEDACGEEAGWADEEDEQE